MHRFEKAALASTLLVLAFFGRSFVVGTLAYMDLDRSGIIDGLSRGELPLWILGGLLATFGPMAIAVCFWRWSRRARKAWVLHLLFLPCAFIALTIGDRLMGSLVDDPGFDATLGSPDNMAVLLFLMAVGGYFLALLRRYVRGLDDRASAG